MRHFFVNLIVLSLVFPLLLLNQAAAFKEDFNDDKADDFEEVSGEWKVENKEYIQKQEGAGTRNLASGYAVGNKVWKDYTFTVKIKPITVSNYAGVMFRVQTLKAGKDGNTFGSSHYYYWLIGIGGNYSKIWQSPSGQALEQNPGKTLQSGKWNEVKVEMVDQNVKLYLNGKLEKDFDFPKDFQLNYGGIALATYNASASFDDVKVEGPGIPTFPVSPKEKLATSWGALKTK